MKVLLSVLCVTVIFTIVFFGGCVFLLTGGKSNPLALALFAIVLLNLAVLAVNHNWMPMPSWPLYLLAGIDVLLALATGFFVAYSFKTLSYGFLFAMLPVAFAAIKGFITIQVAKERQN